jgi:hypothetical protein
MRKLTFAFAALAGLSSASAEAAGTPFFTASDGTAWSLDKSSILPLKLREGIYQFWMTGVAPATRTVRQYKVRVYLDCRSKWSVASAIASIDANGTTLSTTYKGWAAENWKKPDPAGVIANAAKLVCPAA